MGAGSEHRATRAAFLLTNRSVSGFWQISVDVILFDYQNTVVGINSIIANAFQALETREMSVLWYEVLPPIQRFTVQISSRALSDTNRIRL